MLEPTDLFETAPTNDREKVAQQLATDMAWYQLNGAVKRLAAGLYDGLMESLPDDTVCEE